MLVLVFLAALAFFLLRSRRKRRRRPASGLDLLAAARVQGEFPSYDSRPHRADPMTGLRDWGQ